ncbi:T9SS type A sorting domain-containing protein [Pedobacter sp. SD-b]|uniref:T9SS type A sorting domain-containing protein n=1 Tax=Pedobacter segetis TaxID=2793069 RepID=A0ABS1BLB1_9SPHI|nr:T9SS type A sorting domain-containing protein [Pedobacter segetis]MBK0383096.1 T9SS type A sorting domain-containing protein [Pedobacter segetis]
MKKSLLYFTFIFAVLFVFEAKAQSFDYDVTAADPATASFPTSTQGGISLTTTAPVATDGSSPVYKMLNISSNSYDVTLSSTTSDIRQVIYYVRGAGTSTAATPVVTYGVSSSDPAMVTSTAQSATSAAPGAPLTYIFPMGTRYVKMVRIATVRVFRIAAGPSSFTLPLDFLSFTAKADALGKTVALNWSTTNEINTKNFEIQRRTDVTEFKTIGKVISKNTAGIHNYSFTDGNVSQGSSYYQILQFDNDGASKPSVIVPVNIKSATALSIYPNPVENSLGITHALASNAFIKILSLDGKTIIQKKVDENSTSTQLDVSQLASGSYLIVLDNNNEKSTLKFIKK